MTHTEENIVAAFGELLEERPLNKITVNDISRRCGINRNTFYYHFAGIPSLLERTIQTMMDQVIQTYSRFGSLPDCLAPMVRYASEHRKAVLHIYRSTQRETFIQGLDRVARYAVTRYVQTVTEDCLPDAGRTREMELLVWYYKCTLVGILLDWLDAGMKYDLLCDMTRLCDLLNGAGQRAILKCADSQSRGAISRSRS